MISADDANIKRNDKQVAVTASDLVSISDFSKMIFKASAQPKELDNSEFVSLCYLQAVERVLAQKGICFSANYVKKQPYESVEE